MASITAIILNAIQVKEYNRKIHLENKRQNM